MFLLEVLLSKESAELRFSLWPASDFNLYGSTFLFFSGYLVMHIPVNRLIPYGSERRYFKITDNIECSWKDKSGLRFSESKFRKSSGIQKAQNLDWKL